MLRHERCPPSTPFPIPACLLCLKRAAGRGRGNIQPHRPPRPCDGPAGTAGTACVREQRRTRRGTPIARARVVDLALRAASFCECAMFVAKTAETERNPSPCQPQVRTRSGARTCSPQYKRERTPCAAAREPKARPGRPPLPYGPARCPQTVTRPRPLLGHNLAPCTPPSCAPRCSSGAHDGIDAHQACPHARMRLALERVRVPCCCQRRRGQHP